MTFAKRAYSNRRECDIQVGESIAFYRKRKGISQAELAKRCNFAHSTINYLEHGMYAAKVHILVEIAKQLDCKVIDLVSGL